MKTPLSIIENGKLELNKIIKDTLKVVLPQLETFKGKKLCKVDNSLMKSAEVLKTLLPKLDKYNNIYFDCSRTAIKLNFSIYKSGGSYDAIPSTGYCEHFENSITLGRLDSQVLTTVETYNDINAGYGLDRELLNMSDEMAKVELFKKLNAELNDLFYSIDNIVRDDQNIRLR